jgi:hypothetical protein
MRTAHNVAFRGREMCVDDKMWWYSIHVIARGWVVVEKG